MPKNSPYKAEILSQITNYERDIAYLIRQKDLYNKQARVPTQLELEIATLKKRINQLQSMLRNA